MSTNNGWQPIATAPRDGRWILIYVPDPGDHLPPCGFVAVKWTGNPKTSLTGWTTRGVCGIEPNYWMPLPDVPE